MKALRFAALLLPVAIAGCIITTGQFNIDYELGDLLVNGFSVDREPVDLNDNSDYTEHKADLDGLTDMGLTGTATNNSGGPIEVEVWITPGATTHTTPAQVRASAQRLWGPFDLATGETKRITWDESAKLFRAEGKNVLFNELKGDGAFTLYAISGSAPAAGTAQLLGGSDVSITDARLIMVVEAEN